MTRRRKRERFRTLDFDLGGGFVLESELNASRGVSGERESDGTFELWAFDEFDFLRHERKGARDGRERRRDCVCGGCR